MDASNFNFDEDDDENVVAHDMRGHGLAKGLAMMIDAMNEMKVSDSQLLEMPFISLKGIHGELERVTNLAIEAIRKPYDEQIAELYNDLAGYQSEAKTYHTPPKHLAHIMQNCEDAIAIAIKELHAKIAEVYRDPNEPLPEGFDENNRH